MAFTLVSSIISCDISLSGELLILMSQYVSERAKRFFETPKLCYMFKKISMLCSQVAFHQNKSEIFNAMDLYNDVF